MGRSIIFVLASPLLLASVSADDEIPPPSAVVEVIEDDGDRLLLWQPPPLVHGTPTGYRIYGRLDPDAQGVLIAAVPGTQLFFRARAELGYEQLEVSAVMGLEESQARSACVALRLWAQDPKDKVSVRAHCPGFSETGRTSPFVPTAEEPSMASTVPARGGFLRALA